MEPQQKALYAFANGTINNTLYGPGTHKQTALIEGGTVAVFMRPMTTWKSGYKDAVKRAKAIFRTQYGAEITGGVQTQKFVL